MLCHYCTTSNTVIFQRVYKILNEVRFSNNICTKFFSRWQKRHPFSSKTLVCIEREHRWRVNHNENGLLCVCDSCCKILVLIKNANLQFLLLMDYFLIKSVFLANAHDPLTQTVVCLKPRHTEKKNQNDADVFRDASNKKQINWSEIMKNNDIFIIFFKKSTSLQFVPPVFGKENKKVILTKRHYF